MLSPPGDYLQDPPTAFSVGQILAAYVQPFLSNARGTSRTMALMRSRDDLLRQSDGEGRPVPASQHASREVTHFSPEGYNDFSYR